MTKGDLQYASGLLVVLVGFVLAAWGQQWLIASILGVLLLMFVWHLSVNLSRPMTQDEVLGLLESAVDPDRSPLVINGSERDDYSTWDAFCDTPIVNDPGLNRIRAQCYALTNDPQERFFRDSDEPDQRVITDAGVAAVRELIQELRMRGAHQGGDGAG